MPQNQGQQLGSPQQLLEPTHKSFVSRPNIVRYPVEKLDEQTGPAATFKFNPKRRVDLRRDRFTTSFKFCHKILVKRNRQLPLLCDGHTLSLLQ